MQIPQIKTLLTITELLNYLGIPTKKTVAKSYSIRCPFHEEKNKLKKNMSVYPGDNTVYCFSTKCKTHPHSQDVIGVVKHYYNLGDHEAIMKSKQIIYELGKWPVDLLNPFATANEQQTNEQPAINHSMKTAEKKEEETEKQNPAIALTRNHYGQLCYISKHLQIHLLNEPEIKSLNSMRVGLLVQKNPHVHACAAIRQGTIDLYHYEGLQKFIKKTAEQLTITPGSTQEAFAECIELLEKYKMEKHLQQQHKKQQLDMPTPLPLLTPAQQQLMEEILQSNKIVEKINELIGKAGIIGEENNRIFLFTILSAYKLQQPLSALIQGSSGSGKTALFAGVLQFFPEKDVFNSTRITDGSLYNFGEHELMFKIIANEDIDGLSPQALFALRELVSKGFIISSTTIKDEDGNIKSALIKVNGPVSFAGCTTQAALYEDNMGRVFTIAVDESMEQTKRIIDYQNKKSAGKIDKQQQGEAILLLQHIVQKLQPVEVINAYAEYINLPNETHQLRRLNALFKIYIEQITRLHQHAEKPDNKGVYRTTKQHIQLSADSFFECIVLKCDELNGEIRKFYEWLKAYISKKSKAAGEDKKQYRFTQREIRQGYNKSKASISNYFQYLTELEYISSSGGNNRKVMYQIDYWDDYQAMRKRLKDFIQQQIDALPDAG
ncbi:MAG: hypothetical protein IPJ81_08700 [Chitinophagaceae bacterium]|nr:hypothetical protein [Chitinophagaceae bacterium]